jgi:hypothetical protein
VSAHSKGSASVRSTVIAVILNWCLGFIGKLGSHTYNPESGYLPSHPHLLVCPWILEDWH